MKLTLKYFIYFVSLIAIGIFVIFKTDIYNFFDDTNKEEIKIFVPDKLSKNMKTESKKNVTVLPKKTIMQKHNINDDIELQAIFIEKNIKWLVVLRKSNSKTLMLNIGDTVLDYKLKNIYENYALFNRKNSLYKLYLSSAKMNSYNSLDKNIKKSTAYKTSDSFSHEYKDELNNNKKTIRKKDISVDREFINSYIYNPFKIWKDISISEINKNNTIDGFSVDKISNKSLIEKIGIKKGDIIKMINGKNIKNYGEIFKVYNNIRNLDHLNISILRKGAVMELQYDIK